MAGDATGKAFQGIRGTCTSALRYLVFQVQIEGIPSYDEEQVTLVIQDSSSFSKKVSVILGMPILHRVIRSMKESEMGQVPMAWQQVKTAYEITNNIPVFKVSYKPDTGFPTNTGQDPTEVNVVVTLTEKLHIMKIMPIYQMDCMSSIH